MNSPQTRIITAFVIGLFLVGGAFWKAQTRPEPTVNNAGPIVASLDTREYIPVVDSNDDGVPDWQDQIVDGEPIYIDTSTSTEPYVIPDTLTAKYAIQYYTDTAALANFGLLDNVKDDLITNTVEQLRRETAPTPYDITQINTVYTKDPEARKAYGGLAAAIIYTYSSEDLNEYEAFQSFIKTDTPEMRAAFERIEGQYDHMITDLLALETPSDLAQLHVNLINSLLALKTDTKAMSQYYQDPLFTHVRYQGFSNDVITFMNALIEIYNTLYLEGIRFEPDNAMSVMINSFN